MIGIIDTGISNIRSMEVSIETLGFKHRKITGPEDANGIDKLIFPGVGSFNIGMQRVRETGLDGIILDRAGEGMPVLGVCLGMQVLFSAGEEFGSVAGLGLIDGRVVKLDNTRPGVTVPNIGWHRVTPAQPGRIDFSGEQYFYHIHSFHALPDDPATITGEIRLGDERVVVAVEKGNIFGVQFHTEKSQDAGLDLLQAFLKL